MRFSAEDRKLIHTLAQQHQISEGAVEALWVAIQAGNGTLAQFNHPELGGMGQWMASGMIMIGDFSNHQLKATIAQLCTDIAAHLHKQPPTAQSHTATSRMEPLMPAQAGWWPKDLGTPTASGAQNTMQYAYFAAKKRLALRIDGRIRIYDTKDHQIHSVSQQQDHSQKIVFHSQKGEVALDKLSKLSEDKA
ncbi:MAG: SHOCT domain-containing protein [Chloroflexi bacterium]|nr:SHOCT domain-containing protein [Chloroflexota bacterium]